MCLRWLEEVGEKMRKGITISESRTLVSEARELAMRQTTIGYGRLIEAVEVAMQAQERSVALPSPPPHLRLTLLRTHLRTKRLR